ncbi:heptaprenyl diphosphate synthase component 1 [Bacillus sp. FJAT-22090]|uniref:heptaprenyl diphosphate synthase component 1 n=1 Tax=Bacillus sp. FJAT-22090 TaxID=1581038 RepID=UPI0011A0344E|nr:heptaprenyl diphosphate synthase component 1 [Bacillus sp. FJAT-22090]
MNEALITQHVEQYKKDILMQIGQSTLLKYTGTPVIDEERLFFTLLPLLNGEDWNESERISVIATSLIFSALAAHDLVKEKNATSKEQQLQVLAGDYYSGKYYQLLAKDKKIDLIRQLSECVTSITEHKTRFYDLNEYTFEQLIQSIQLIESKPIEQFMEYYAFHEYVFIMKEALLLTSLKKEIVAFEQTESTLYIGKSRKLQSNLDSLQTEIKKIENDLVRDVRSSQLLKEHVKHAILERVAKCSLEKQLREG